MGQTGEAEADKEDRGEGEEQDELEGMWLRAICTFYELVCLCFLSLAELWGFVHHNELINSSEMDGPPAHRPLAV